MKEAVQKSQPSPQKRSAQTAVKPAPAAGGPMMALDLAFQLFTGPASSQDQSHTEAAPYGAIVDDELPAGEAQVQRRDFMRDVEAAINETVDSELRKAGRSSADCPYLAHWLAFYRTRSALQIERAIQKYAQPERTDPEGLKQAVLERVRSAVRAWVATQGRDVQIPAEVAPMGSTDGVPGTGETGAVQTMSESGGLPSPARGGASAVLARLGPGRPLDNGVRTRMERSFGTNFGDVRLHTDARAARISGQYRARAFAVGNNIAFNHGQYRPGTVPGDLLIAHELAHTLQQRGSRFFTDRVLENGDLEHQARLAAARVILPSKSAPNLPLGRSDLQIASCNSAPDPAKQVDPVQFQAAVDNLRALYARKQAVVDGTEPATNLDDINRQISDAERQLHEWGVQLEGEELLKAVQGGQNLMQMQASIMRVPSGTVPWGTRVNLQLLLNYVPIGRTVEVAWRVRGRDQSHEWQLTPARRDLLQKWEIGEGFWAGASGNSISKERGFEIVAHVFLGSEEVERLAPSTGWIDLDNTVPTPLKLETDSPAVVAGSRASFHIAGWAPYFPEYSLNWQVNGKDVLADAPVLNRTFDDAGTYTIKASVYRVERKFGIQNRVLVEEPTTELKVVTPSAAGQEALDQMAKTPLPGVQSVQTSTQQTITELQRHVDIGGEQQPYWQDRLKKQKSRLADLQKFLPVSSQAMPADATAVAAGTSYASPFPAVLVVPNAGGAQPLSVYVTAQFDGANWNASVVDTTGEVQQITGSSCSQVLDAYKTAFRAWMMHHPYPRGGRVLYQFSPPGWDLPLDFETNNPWNLAESWLNSIIEIGGMIVAGLLLMAPTAGITQAIGLIVLSATIARSSIAIYQNMSRGMEWDDTRNVLEGITILLSVLGIAGTALRTLGVRLIRPLLYRIGSWTVMASLAGDVGTLVYATASAMEQIRLIQSDPNLADDQKTMQLLRIMASLIMQGAMLVVANRDLFKGGLRQSDFFRTNAQTGADEAITKQAAGQTVTLEPGQRLDIAAELRRRGDSADQLRKISPGELVNRYTTLGWLEASLGPAEVEAMLKKLSTSALTSLSEIPASEAHGLLARIGDAVVNALAPGLRGPGLSDLEQAVGGMGVRDLHASFGTDGVVGLVNEVTSPNIGRLLLGSSAAQLNTRSQSLGNAVLRNYGQDLTGGELTTLLGKHDESLVRWAGTDQRGAAAQNLLNGVQRPALLGLEGSAGPGGVTGSQATQLVAQFGVPVINEAAPLVGGRDLMEVGNAFGPEARGIAENLASRRQKGSTHSLVTDLSSYAANLRSARTPPSAGGTGELVAPRPAGAGTVIMDSNYYNYLSRARTRIAAGDPVSALPIVEQNVYRDWQASRAAGHVDERMTTGGIAEEPVSPAVGRAGIQLDVPRTDPQYRSVMQSLETAGVGVKAVTAPGPGEGIMDRQMVADALFSTPSGSEAVLKTADSNLYRRLAQFASPPIALTGGGTVRATTPGGVTLEGYRALPFAYPNGFSISFPSAPGRSLLIKPISGGNPM